MNLFFDLLRWLVWIGLVAWILFYWRGGGKIFEDISTALRGPATRLDAILLIGMTGGTLVLLSLGLAVNLGWLRADPASDWLALPGAGLTLAGIAGTFYCRAVLGRVWTAETRVNADQPLVSAGPYGLVRHPIYTAAILLYAGLGLVYPLAWSALASGLVVVGYLLKTHDEDRYLQAHFAGYPEYARRVCYRLIPGVW